MLERSLVQNNTKNSYPSLSKNLKRSFRDLVLLINPLNNRNNSRRSSSTSIITERIKNSYYEKMNAAFRSDDENNEPMFSDDTGEALNEAARRLIKEATGKDVHLADDVNDGNDGNETAKRGRKTEMKSDILRTIDRVRIALGVWKYVLIDLKDERTEERMMIVRSYENLAYHADNYRVAMREIRNEFGSCSDDDSRTTIGIEGRVIGGGRIEWDGLEANVYGYSMTFGRTEGCNRKTSEIIRDSLKCDVKWSDDGY